MNSLDTNILVYATNADCPEHVRARAVVERMLEEPAEWIVADQVLLEYYRLVRNPAVLTRPLNAASAVRQVEFFRHEAGCAHCAYDATMWPALAALLRSPSFPGRGAFDAVLAVTLKAHGVKRLFTRNKADFDRFGWFDVVDPLSSQRTDRRSRP